MKTNYHTHNYLCKHATGTIEDYVKKAVLDNYDVLGLSDHGPLPEDLRQHLASRRMSLEEYYMVYLPSLAKVKASYGRLIKIYTALEYEYFPVIMDTYPKMLKDLDYLILGQHYVIYNNEYYSTYDSFSKEMVTCYMEQVIEAMETGYFKILAHPDLFLWGYNKWDDFAKEVSLKIVKAAIDNNVVIEMNANGIRNCEERNKYIINEDGTKNYCYPNKDFWNTVKELNPRVIINADAHAPSQLNDKDMEKTYQMAKDLGIKIIDTDILKEN